MTLRGWIRIPCSAWAPLSVVLLSGCGDETSAAFEIVSPGPGRIAFTSARGGCPEIYAMNADGSGVVELINGNDHYCSADANGAAWSPDGTKIAFYYSPNVSIAAEDIYVMNVDGSRVAELIRPTGTFFGRADPAWSRDGTRIAAAEKVGRCDNPRTCRFIFYHRIAVMSADGAGVTNLTNNNSAYDASPAWSPDGTKIAFRSNRTGVFDLYVMNADGTGVTALTADSATEGRPAWSPDGTTIAFASDRD